MHESRWQIVYPDFHRDQRWNSFQMLIMAGLCFTGAVIALVVLRQYFFGIVLLLAAVALCVTIAGERLKREKWAATEQFANPGAPAGPVVNYATPQKSAGNMVLRVLGIIFIAILLTAVIIGGIVLLLVGLCFVTLSGVGGH
jgi:hypothetical protein